ncbi:MAG: hypothetical protein AAGI88_12345 [Pseudomonadota bacterium]
MAGEPIPFNVPAGQFEPIYEIPIEENGGFSCDVDADSTGTNEDWGSGIVMVLTSPENTFATQLTYSPENGFNIFEIRALDDVNSYTYRSEFLRLRDDGAVVTLTLSWRDDGLIVYRGKDSNTQQGTGYIINPNQVFGAANVFASGVRGTVLCYRGEL